MNPGLNRSWLRGSKKQGKIFKIYRCEYSQSLGMRLSRVKTLEPEIAEKVITCNHYQACGILSIYPAACDTFREIRGLAALKITWYH